MATVTIRPATPEDRAWILPLSSRLHDFGPPPFRPRERMDAAVAGWIGQAFESPGEEKIVLVAQDEQSRPVGFLYVHEAEDFFTGETHGHVSDVVVAERAQGGGVGRMLMAAAEEWSRARGHRLLSLNVFERNVRARTLYEKLGFESDTSKMVKVLRR